MVSSDLAFTPVMTELILGYFGTVECLRALLRVGLVMATLPRVFPCYFGFK